MKLYSGPLSLFTAKVRVALDEKGLDHEVVTVPFSRSRGYDPKHPDVLELNPKGQVPVLVDGPLALFDSTVILEYLEDRYPSPPLYPSDVAERARCRQLEAAADEILFPSVFELITQVFYGPARGGPDQERIVSARAAIAWHYDNLERRIDGRSHLAGEFSVADIAYALTVTFAGNFGVPLGDPHPKLRTWYDRVLARPSMTTELARLAEGMRQLSG